MVGELFIKSHTGISPINGSAVTIDGETWIDTYLQWGLSFSDTALSSLFTPAANKAVVENKSRIQNGKQIIRDSSYVKKDERDVSLEMHITARTKAAFWDNYNRFISEVLDYGFMDIKSTYRQDLVFRMTYISCTQFSEFIQEMAKFTLKLNEPDPTNRSTQEA